MLIMPETQAPEHPVTQSPSDESSGCSFEAYDENISTVKVIIHSSTNISPSANSTPHFLWCVSSLL
ncbi:hypothetical protein INR49_024589 [Caranx melampygus]|nr:hypothetical protein INR49_024589 [Caranx melampygus]